jgi:hypothetical protein
MSENTKPTGDAVGFRGVGGQGAAPFSGSHSTPTARRRQVCEVRR